MEWTEENIEIIANSLVESMNAEELRQYVYEDLCDVMGDCEELFQINAEGYPDGQ